MNSLGVLVQNIERFMGFLHWEERGEEGELKGDRIEVNSVR